MIQLIKVLSPEILIEMDTVFVNSLMKASILSLLNLLPKLWGFMEKELELFILFVTMQNLPKLFLHN